MKFQNNPPATEIEMRAFEDNLIKKNKKLFKINDPYKGFKRTISPKNRHDNQIYIPIKYLGL